MIASTKSSLLRLAFIIGVVVLAMSVSADEPPTNKETQPPAAESTNSLDAVLQLFGGAPIDNSQVEAATTADPLRPSLTPPTSSTGEDENSDDSPTKARETKFKIYTNYATAVRESQLSNRPLLVVLGAKWCSWCRKLEADLETPDAATALAEWIVVTVDVDDEPEIARKLESSALPALRILGPWQAVVASQEGYLELPELQKWLADNRATADPAKYAVLYDTAVPDDATVEKLVTMLAETSPMARNAAMERLAAHPRAAAPALVQALKTGRLVQQLCACDVLRRWQAPLGKIDPWQPESLQTDEFGQLVTWSRKVIDSDAANAANAKPGDAEAPPINTQAINDLLLRLMKAEANERATVIAQLLGVGPKLAAEVRSRLAHADAIDDTARESLRELLYNMLASRKLRLQQAGVVAALGRLDLDSHRQAAETVLDKSEVIDQPLVDELARDTDPLIRELAIRALGRLKLLSNDDRIRELLADSDPNVRAAVLRMLAEHPSDESVESLCAYLQQESNEDLLVHGAKCLGQLHGQPKAMATMAQLATNKSWRVRAAAIDAVVQAIEKASEQSVDSSSRTKTPLVPAEMANAILAAAFEQDAFVAQRAAKALPEIIKDGMVDEATLQNIARTLAEHPDQLQRIIDASQENPRLTHGVDQSQQTFAPLVNPAKTWLEKNDPQQIQHAAVILGRFAPSELNDHMGTLLASKNPTVRLTALRAALHSLADYRKTNLEEAAATWAAHQAGNSTHARSTITPWYDLPNAPAKEAAPEKTDAADVPAEAPAAAAKNDAEQPESKITVVDIVAGLFGKAPKSAPADADAEKKSKQASEDVLKEALANALPSSWMNRWQAKHADVVLQWITASETATQTLLTSDDPTERTWAHAVWLALGHTEHVDELLSLLKEPAPATKSDKGAAPTPPSLSDVLSWLPANKRAEKAQELITAAGSENNALLSSLEQCTLIDSEPLADWIFAYLEKSPLNDAKSQTALSKILIRARVGGFMDGNLSDYLKTEEYSYGKEPPYRVTLTKEAATIPGYIEACDWLRQKYHATANDRQHAVALLAVAALDHRTAVNAALEAIQQSKDDNDFLPAALAIIFSDAQPTNARRAATLLNHPAPQVQTAALAVLASGAMSAHFREPPTAPRVFDTTTLPGLWSTTDPLPAKVLQALAKSDAQTQQTQAKLLLLATGEHLDLAELERDLKAIDSSQAKLFVSASLAKAKRTDEEALAYYRETYPTVSHEGGDVRLIALYEVLRELPGDEAANLRSKMRNEKGAQLFQRGNSDIFN